MTYSYISGLSRSTYNRRRKAQRNRRGSALSSEATVVQNSSMSSFIVMSAAVCLLLVIYLLLVNSSYSYSYVIDGLNQERQQLQSEYDALFLEGVKLKSNQHLSTGSTSGEYLLPETIHFR